MKSIPTPWFKHLPPDEQEEFKLSLRASHRVLSRLRELINEDCAAIDTSEEKEENYNDGYPYKQAFLNGQRKSLKHMLNLLSFLED